MPQIRNLTDAQDALRPFYDNTRTPYTLDMMHQLMEYLGNPQDKLRVIHIAGTSGKTSTAYYCATLLHASGKSVGLSVSPHVDTVNERLQVNGAPLNEPAFCAVLEEFLQVIADSGLRPSYFELLVAMAYWEFARQGVDYAVIEVGLGGLLDGTNIVSRADKICVITDIGFDHTEILGDTLTDIATQKAGIIQDKNVVFMYAQDDEVMTAVKAAVARHEATMLVFDDTIIVEQPGLPAFQGRNLGLAQQTVGFALQRDFGEDVSDEAVQVATNIQVPARLERFKVGDKTVIVDGSHNQQKLTTLLDSVKKLYPEQDIAVLCAFVQGNSGRWQGGLLALLPAAKHIVFTSFHSEQDVPKSSVNPDELVKYCENQGYAECQIATDPATAYRTLQQRPEPLLLVTGSFYLLNHIRPLISKEHA